MPGPWGRGTAGRTLMGLALLAACGAGERIVEPGEFLPPEQTGTRLSVDGVRRGSFLRWAVPSEVVVSTLEGSPGATHQIRGIQVEGGQVRVRDGPRADGAHYGTMEVSADGVELYFTVGTDRALYHARDGAEAVQVESATPSSGWSTYSARGVTVLPMRDSRSAAYITTTDSVMVFDAATRTSRPLAYGCRALLDFSPDGAELLCRHQDALYVVTMRDGSVRPFALPAGLSIHSVASARWTPDGVKLLAVSSQRDASIVDAVTGAAAPLIGVAGFEEASYTNIAWSPDGRSLAFTSTHCELFTCDAEQHRIYVGSLDFIGVRLVAAINFLSAGGDHRIGQFAFSPDGRRLAYVAGSSVSASLYVVPVL